MEGKGVGLDVLGEYCSPVNTTFWLFMYRILFSTLRYSAGNCTVPSKREYRESCLVADVVNRLRGLLLSHPWGGTLLHACQITSSRLCSARVRERDKVLDALLGPVRCGRSGAHGSIEVQHDHRREARCASRPSFRLVLITWPSAADDQTLADARS